MLDFNEKEITEHIEKIRKMYANYALEYNNNKAFNLDLFNERYLEALKGKINLRTFIKAELDVLEELKKRAKDMHEENMRLEKEREDKDKRYFMNKLDAILESFADNIKKYPKKKVHENDNEEISRLNGALAELYTCFRLIKPVLTSLNDYGVETMIKDIDNKFQAFTLAGSYGRPAHIFLDYYDVLETGGETTRSEQFILKESGFFLHFFVAKCDQIASFTSKIPPDAIIKMPDYLEKESPRVYKSFVGKTQIDVFFATKSYAQSMIDNFRLQNFKQNDR